MQLEWPSWLLLVVVAQFTHASHLEIAMVMQETNFINVSLVAEYYVNQRNLGDVFISPCQTEMYSDDHSGICRDCAQCTTEQYPALQCLIYQNRVCRNCTVCSSREIEVCFCGYRTPTCYTGDRVCAPLIAKDVGLTIQFSVPKTLTVLEEQFAKSGFNTGYVLFLSLFFQHSASNTKFIGMTQVSPTKYNASFVLERVYDPAIIYAVNHMTKADVQDGLRFTFAGSKRRLLDFVNPFSPISEGASSDGCTIPSHVCDKPFWVFPPEPWDCDSKCKEGPCPVGYTGPDGVCMPCEAGTYKDITGNSTCDPCPDGLSTIPGANSSDLCLVIYPATTTFGTGTVGPILTTTAGSPVTTPAPRPTTQPQTTPPPPRPTTQPQTTPPPPPPPPPGQTQTITGGNQGYTIVMDGSTSIISVVGIMVAGVVAVLLASIAALVYCFKIMRARRQQQDYIPIPPNLPVIRHEIIRPSVEHP
jgi:hypothetical protein